jgi:hypothetical protein
VGPAILADGSNINPAALALLQFKLPNGNFLIPTPQTIDTSRPLDAQGFSVFSAPCTFNENQEMMNLDYLPSTKSHFSSRLFVARNNQLLSLPIGGFASAEAPDTVPGFPGTTTQNFLNYTLTYTYVINSNLVNEFAIGYNRSFTGNTASTAFNFSDVGIQGAPANENALPDIEISGCCDLSAAYALQVAQNTYHLQDSLSYSHGRHTIRIGGGITRAQDNISKFDFNGVLLFLSWPDLLLGLDSASNGSPFSNVYGSAGLVGQLDRAWRTWDGFSYVQDDFKVYRRLTLNLGLRYERIGGLGDDLGRNANFYPNLANPNPPPTGTLQGFVVPNNFTDSIPSGVAKLGNNLGVGGDGQNAWEPRVGFAWQVLPQSTRLVLRGGYGIAHSRTIGNQYFQLITDPPFGDFFQNFATENASATLTHPFPTSTPMASDFPLFTPYSPTSALTGTFLSAEFQPAVIQQYSLNVQTQLAQNFLLEVGYVGTRGTKLPRTLEFNQALSASVANPIRGQTSNTLANLGERVPIEGFQPTGIGVVQTSGASWYNGLEVSLTKHTSKGLYFLASYTFSRALDTDAAQPVANTQGTGGGAIGDQTDPLRRYGPSGFNREHRFVFSSVYNLPQPPNRQGFVGKIASGWSLAGVITIQSGQYLTLTGSNGNNVFGITNDFAEIAPGCTAANLVTPGSLTKKLNNYFDASCFAPYPVIGADGIGTGFGNLGSGVATGPGQQDVNISLSKKTNITERTALEFRTEFFNAFNHPQFANPDTVVTDSTFGAISHTSVNPRIIQLALKLMF